MTVPRWFCPKRPLSSRVWTRVSGVRDGQPFCANGRVTFVVAKRGADWLIVHFHRSAMPN